MLPDRGHLLTSGHGLDCPRNQLLLSGSFKDDLILLSAELIQQSIDINMNSTVLVPGYQH